MLYTHRAPGKETANEDCVGLIPYQPASGILLVADGLGGLPAGATASQLAAESLQRVLTSAPQEMALRDVILDGFEQSNRLILEKGMGSATTLAVVEIQGNEIRPYHVGDSMILVTGQRGKIKTYTVSHSPVGYAVEAGILDEKEAVHHEERHLISNVVGANDMSIAIGTSIIMDKYDTLLLSSDGLFDNLYIEEIIELIRKGPLEMAANNLIAKCARRMENPEANKPSHPDDLSFILFRQS